MTFSQQQRSISERVATRAALTGAFAAALVLVAPHHRAHAAAGQSATEAQAAAGTLFSPDKLAALLPQTVYFEGRSAAIQLRNAAGVRFEDGTIVWAALVDTSGYASDVQQAYQFYLVTEGKLRVGTAQIGPGAYGGGFEGDRFVLMDIGGHKIAEGATEMDASMRRPRPLQMLPRSPDEVQLALGRHLVGLHAE